jgi:3-hydroxyisobutyrate dehydrogenase-like beta-hydroxyacid dehydrogenase
MSEILRWGAKVAACRRTAVAEAVAILTVLADTAIMSPVAKLTVHAIIKGLHAPMFHLHLLAMDFGYAKAAAEIGTEAALISAEHRLFEQAVSAGLSAFARQVAAIRKH